MPKDNEVDEKVEDFFERLYGMTFRLFLDPNSEEDEGNTVELRLGATVDNLALFETQDHAVLHTAATVAELRAEVERLNACIDAVHENWMNYGPHREIVARADAAERRVWELEVALKSVLDANDDADPPQWKGSPVQIECLKALTGADPA